MASKLKTDILETVSGSGTIALTNQLSGMTSASVPTGSVLQVVTMNTVTTFSGSSTTFANTNSLLAITPTSTSSKIVGYITGFGLKGAENQFEVQYRIAKNGATLAPASDWSLGSSGSNELYVPITFHFSDSPSTTSATTYSLQMRCTNSSTSGSWYRKQTVTLMEVAG